MKENELLALIRSEITALKNTVNSNKTANTGSLSRYLNVESRTSEEGEEIVDESTLGKIPKFIKDELDKKFNTEEPKGTVIVFYTDELKKLFNNDESIGSYGSVIVLMNDNHKILNDKLDTIINKLNSIDDSSQLSTISNKLDSIETSISDLQDSVNQLIDNSESTT